MTTAPQPSPRPRPIARDLGIAERSIRAILDRHLADAGLSFPEWVTLIFLTSEGPLSPDEIVRQQVAGMVAPEAEVRAALDGMVRSGIAAFTDDGAQLAITAQGEALFRPLEQVVLGVSRQLWAGVPTEDIDTAQRVLGVVIERASKVLADLDTEAA